MPAHRRGEILPALQTGRIASQRKGGGGSSLTESKLDTKRSPLFQNKRKKGKGIN